MKRKRTFLILSIVFTSLAVLCVLFVLWSYNFKMSIDEKYTSVIAGIALTLSTFALAPATAAFGVLGGAFSALALKKQEAKAPYITALSLVFFVFGLVDWVYIMSIDKSLTDFYTGIHFALLVYVLTIWTIAFGVLGSVFSCKALKKQKSKPLNITTLAVSSGLSFVSVCWFIYLVISAQI